MQPLDKTVYECSFPRAYFTDERDKALAVLNAIHQPAQGLFDLLGKKKVTRIWIDIERIVFQSEEAFIHCVCTFLTSRYSIFISAAILSLLLDLENLEL